MGEILKRYKNMAMLESFSKDSEKHFYSMAKWIMVNHLGLNPRSSQYKTSVKNLPLMWEWIQLLDSDMGDISGKNLMDSVLDDFAENRHFGNLRILVGNIGLFQKLYYQKLMTGKVVLGDCVAEVLEKNRQQAELKSNDEEDEEYSTYGDNFDDEKFALRGEYIMNDFDIEDDIVNENPFKAFHGSRYSFKEFDLSLLGATSSSDPLTMLGIHLSLEKDTAMQFAKGMYLNKKNSNGGSQNLYSCVVEGGKYIKVDSEEKLHCYLTYETLKYIVSDMNVLDDFSSHIGLDYELVLNHWNKFLFIENDVYLQQMVEYLRDHSEVTRGAANYIKSHFIQQNIKGILYPNDAEGGNAVVVFNPKDIIIIKRTSI